jgi:hypothetical protein
MEVRCINCGIFFSVDDKVYRGEYENFCGIKCQSDWMDKEREKMTSPTNLSPDGEGEEWEWTIPEEKKDGESN